MTTLRVNITILIVTIICLVSCGGDRAANKKIEGDLYYDFFRIGSFYNEPDSVVKKIKLYIDTVDRKMVDSADRKNLAIYDLLKKEKLLNRPFIDLKLDNDSIVKIYLTTNDYDKIKIYSYQELIDTKKKIRLSLEVDDLGPGIAVCTRLVYAQKVSGLTLQHLDKKLRMEDYH